MSMDFELDRAAAALQCANRVCVLTGAGVSAESGVPTFRASDGLWEGHRIEDVATPTGFRNDPQLVWNFYNARRANVKTVTPNAGHFALVKLEERWGDRFTLVGRDLYLCLPNGVGQTKLTNGYFDRALGTVSTLRNWRTVLAIEGMF